MVGATHLTRFPRGALNVINDNEVWFYYYTEFDLARIMDNKLTTYYPTGISGADGFTIYGDYISFRGGYEDKDDYTLFILEKDLLRKLKV